MNIKLEIPESFYQGEERCGYYVSPEMKKIWAVELDLLNEFARVCEKYNLKWYAYGGTLIGAARHKGFIPWDDDVDIVMMRKDYEKLCEISEYEFKYPYRLYSPYNNQERMLPFAKLHNEDTAMFEEDVIHLIKNGKNFAYSQGMYIDVFPLDDIPDDEKALMKILKKAAFFRNMAYMYYKFYDYVPAPTLWKRPFKAALYYAMKICHFNPPYSKYIRKYMETINLLSSPDSKRIVNSGTMIFYPKLNTPDVFKRSFFAESINLPFEMLELPAPSGYVEVLNKLYGDWSKYQIKPPHGKLYDAERSYKFYLEHGLPSEFN